MRAHGRIGRRLAHVAVAAAVVAPAGTAAATEDVPEGTVVAYGTNENGMCVFPDPVSVTGRAVRTDASCRLVEFDPGEAQVGPAATLVPKVTENEAAPAGGGGPGGVSVGSVGDTGALLDSVTKHATGYRAYRLTAEWEFFNERDQPMYHDKLTVSYRRSNADGTFSQFAPNEGFCATGAGVFPHQPGVERCTWFPAIVTPDTLSFTSKGTYVDTLALVPFDRRALSISIQLRSDRATLAYTCSPYKSLPVGWWTRGCFVHAAPAA